MSPLKIIETSVSEEDFSIKLISKLKVKGTFPKEEIKILDVASELSILRPILVIPLIVNSH